MKAELLFFIAAIAVLSYAITRIVLRIALAKGLIDTPNQRSSHSVPTPRGGGLGFVITTILGIVSLLCFGGIDRPLAFSLGGGGLMIAAVGFADDRGSLPVRLRILVHVAAAVLCVYLLGGFPQVRVGDRYIDLGILGNIVGVIAIVWALNLFNFMDGIDGLAASEAIFVTFAGAFIASGAANLTGTVVAPVLLGAGCLGFLFCNWPPARIFMGDVGSGFLGFALAVLALAAGRLDGSAIFIWLILGGLFVSDATVTLVRRLLRREEIYLAHRSHAYQWLARRWGSHSRVTVLFWLVNVFWLLPCALWCSRRPDMALPIVFLAYAPVLAVIIAGGAGRPET